MIKTLVDRGWVRVLGHREVPGRPAVFGTTKAFLDYFGLRSLGELPALADLANPDDERVGDLQLTMLPEAD
jgi:segregation and condensation protein B